MTSANSAYNKGILAQYSLRRLFNAHALQEKAPSLLPLQEILSKGFMPEPLSRLCNHANALQIHYLMGIRPFRIHAPNSRHW